MVLKYLLPFLLILPLFGIENNLFAGFGGGIGSQYKTDMWQQANKDNPSCAGGTCIGNKTTGSYSGKESGLFFALLGNEMTFDPYHIAGIRVYGSAEFANVSLGNLIPNSTTNTPAKNPSFTTLVTPPNATTAKDGKVNMVDVPSAQNHLFNNGVWMSYGLNLDFFLNIPIDLFIKLFWEKMFFFKIGVYAGGGVEYSMLRSSSWYNQTISQNEKFFASGSGFFLNIGSSIYIGRHNRIDFGVKIPYYGLNAQNWYNYGNNNPFDQQLLRQNFDISKTKEFRLNYVFLF